MRQPRAAGGGSDEEAIASSLSEPARFHVLFERHFDAIHRYAARQAGEHAAEDIASETFVRAFRARSTFDAGAGNARGWLYGIATNLIREHRRAGTRQSRAYAHVERTLGRHRGTRDETAERVVESDRLEAALRSLEPDIRDVVLLVAGAGLSYQEVGEALQIPLGTVGSRMSRGRRQLSAALTDRLAHAHPQEHAARGLAGRRAR